MEGPNPAKMAVKLNHLNRNTQLSNTYHLSQALSSPFLLGPYPGKDVDSAFLCDVDSRISFTLAGSGLLPANQPFLSFFPSGLW